MVQTLKELRIYLVGLSKKIVSNIGRLSHHDEGGWMMRRRPQRSRARAPALSKWENKEGGDLCQQHLELTKIATLTEEFSSS